MESPQIVFGLGRSSDEESLAAFLRLFSNERLTDVLVPRMSDEEIDQILDTLMGLMHRHLQESEYHELFLGEADPPGPR